MKEDIPHAIESYRSDTSEIWAGCIQEFGKPFSFDNAKNIKPKSYLKVQAEQWLILASTQASLEHLKPTAQWVWSPELQNKKLQNAE